MASTDSEEGGGGDGPARLSALQRSLIDGFQRGLPLTPRPYAAMAEALGVRESEVLEALRGLQEARVLSRVGAAIRPGTVGAGTLAAMAVPPERLDEVAALVNAYGEVNHNYRREHVYNLWFVVTAPDADHLEEVLRDIEGRTGLSVLNLPLEEAYHIDLGFPVQWS